MKLRSLTLCSVALSALFGAALIVPASGAGIGGALGGGAGGALGGGAGAIGGTAGGTAGGAIGPAGGSIGTAGSVGSTAGAGRGASTDTGAGVGANAGTGSNSAGVGVGTSAGAAPGVGATGSLGTQANASGAVPITSLPATTSLAEATVQSADGATIGTVSKVTKSGGAIKSVRVKLQGSSGGYVTLKPDQVSFNQSSNVVVASLTQAEISSLKSAKN